MDIEEAYAQFRDIIKRHQLDQKVDEVVEFIMGDTNSEHLAQKYGMSIEEANIFLHVVQKALEFKQNNFK